MTWIGHNPPFHSAREIVPELDLSWERLSDPFAACPETHEYCAAALSHGAGSFRGSYPYHEAFLGSGLSVGSGLLVLGSIPTTRLT